jgi:predicted transcriptional regulator
MPSDRRDDLRAFLRFVAEKLESGGESLTLDDALGLWDHETQSGDEREATVEAIRRGLEDADEGRTVDAFEALAEIRSRLNRNAD